MRLIIKSLSTPIDEGKKKLLREKFLWFEDKLPSGSEMTIGVEEKINKKLNQAHTVYIHLFVPKLKRPIYIKVYSDNFAQAVNTIKNKLERKIVRDKQRGKFKFKLPKIKFSFRQKEEEN